MSRCVADKHPFEDSSSREVSRSTGTGQGTVRRALSLRAGVQESAVGSGSSRGPWHILIGQDLGAVVDLLVDPADVTRFYRRLDKIQRASEAQCLPPLAPGAAAFAGFHDHGRRYHCERLRVGCVARAAKWSVALSPRRPETPGPHVRLLDRFGCIESSAPAPVVFPRADGRCWMSYGLRVARRRLLNRQD